MKNFWSTFWAALLGFVVGTIILQCISFFIFMGLLAVSLSSIWQEPSASLPSDAVLKIDFSNLPEKTQDFDFHLSSDRSTVSLTEMIRAIERAQTNPRVKGIYIDSPMPIAGMASLYELRNAIRAFSESGKWVVAYADNYSQSGYYLASVADEVYVNPQGMIDLKGLASQSLFYRNTLKKLGVEMMIFKVGTYKGAVEPFLLDAYSEANKEQLASYMGGLWKEVREKISGDRKISSAALDSIANVGTIFMNPEQYVRTNLADKLLYEREVMSELCRLTGEDEDDDVNFVSPKEVLRATRKRSKSARDHKVVVCYAEGSITSAQDGSPMVSAQTINEKLAEELQEYALDDDVEAVVLRVSSPGGSAFVSDQIWDAMRFLRSKKPVVVSMGDYAASGGYYISCAANCIYAEPVTVTGSIGIFGMIPNLSSFANKIELKQDVVKTHENADAFSSPFRPLTPGEISTMQSYVENGYRTFLSRVAEGRNMTPQQVDSVGQGRVWTGEQALEIGLVDYLGGLPEAVAKAAELANLTKGTYDVVYKTHETLDISSFSDLLFSRIGMKFMTQFLSETEIAAIQEARTLKSLQGLQAIFPYKEINW